MPLKQKWQKARLNAKERIEKFSKTRKVFKDSNNAAKAVLLHR